LPERHRIRFTFRQYREPESVPMKPREPVVTGQADAFLARLDRLIRLDHPLAKLARAIDWDHLASTLNVVYSERPGKAPLSTRLMAGLLILKQMHNFSDEDVCEQFLQNPYFQYFCGEEWFRHELPLDRSSITHWRQRMGEEKVVVLLQESLATAMRTKAAAPADFKKVAIDTTVQEKAVAFPTEAKLLFRARERLVKLAKKAGITLRQSYERVAKVALQMSQRYAHAKQFKRARREVKRLRSMLGRVERDIQRKIKGKADLIDRFAHPLTLARLVREQKRGDRGKKIHSLHAPEVECIGKGKAHKPYEFGVKVSVATVLHRAAGGQFIAHVKALPGNPYDGHTLKDIIPAIEKTTGAEISRAVVDRGYRGHNAPQDRKMRVYIQGQKRNVTPAIKRELNRRSAIEPVIGHMKSDTGMHRCHLKGSHGDAVNAVLAAVGFNFRLVLRWIAFLRAFIRVFVEGTTTPRAALGTG
jgi:transposase, IS5 family